LRLCVNSVGVVDVFLFADREIRLDRIHLRNRGQNRCRIDEISDLYLGDSRDAVDQGFDVGEFQVQPGLLD